MVASWQILITTDLFGDDVEADLKKIETSRNLAERLKNRPQRTHKSFPRTQNQNYVPENSFNARKRQIAQRLKNKSRSFLGSKAGPGERQYKAQTAPARRQQVTNYKPWTQRNRQRRQQQH